MIRSSTGRPLVGAVGVPWRLLLACMAIGVASGRAGEAPWGNAWSDNAGVLYSKIQPLTIFYTCSVRNVTYAALAECNIVCAMGRCTAREENLAIPSITVGSNSSSSKIQPGLMLGQTLRVTVKGAPGMANISVKEDPGLPVGMVATPGSGAMSLELEWTPGQRQAGMVHLLVITGSLGGVNAKPWTLQIPVIPAALAWAEPGPEGSRTTAVVGSSSSLDLKCSSNYPAMISLSEGHSLPQGMTLTSTSPSSRIYKDGALGPYAAPSAVVTFSPPPRTEGSETTVCFDCSAPNVRDQRCVTFRVDLCQYTSKPGDSLMSVSREVFFQSNWRRLWNINSHLSADPESTLVGGTVITLGPVYTIMPGDSVDSVAGRFHTTRKNILALNPHVRNHLLRAGEGLCIPTCTNKPTPSFDYKQPY